MNKKFIANMLANTSFFLIDLEIALRNAGFYHQAGLINDAFEKVTNVKEYIRDE